MQVQFLIEWRQCEITRRQKRCQSNASKWSEMWNSKEIRVSIPNLLSVIKKKKALVGFPFCVSVYIYMYIDILITHLNSLHITMYTCYQYIYQNCICMAKSLYIIVYIKSSTSKFIIDLNIWHLYNIKINNNYVTYVNEMLPIIILNCMKCM